MMFRSQYAGCLFLLLLSRLCLGQQVNTAGNKAETQTSQASARSAAQKYFTDVVLTNQEGQPMRLYSDLIKDRVVVIDSFFTTCKAACPMLSVHFAKIQDWLGDRLGKDVYLISITVDPETDTPQALKTYSAQFHARPGWYFLSGPKKNVDFALDKLGYLVKDKNDHLSLFIVGNDKTKLWKKISGLSKMEDITGAIDSVLKDDAANQTQ
jgi:protein SCO1/2